MNLESILGKKKKVSYRIKPEILILTAAIDLNSKLMVIATSCLLMRGKKDYQSIIKNIDKSIDQYRDDVNVIINNNRKG